MAIHFDSLQSSSHSTDAKNTKKLICDGLTSLWKKEKADEFRRRRIAPSASSLVAKEMRFVSAKAQQQTDGVTCGWRTVDSARFVAQHCSDAPPNWDATVKKDMSSDYVALAKRCLRIAQDNCAPSVSDIPSILFPLHALVDEACCSQPGGDRSNINQKMVTYFDEIRTGPSRANNKKVAQGKKFKDIFNTVAKEMASRVLDKRKKVSRTVSITQNQCKVLANHVFHYPRGSQYAKCIFHTRYNYPDSILVCTGLNVLMEERPHVLGHELNLGPGRMTKSQKVLNNMGDFLDSNRSTARHWDVVARFRLQELVLHFAGIAEAVLKSCAREARILDGNAFVGRIKDHEDEEEAEDDAIEVIADNTDAPWTFQTSVTIETGTDENGQIRCAVLPKDIASAIVTCVSLADRVANEAITARLSEFEHHFKRLIQLSYRKVKLCDLEHRVTGTSMATIPVTFSKSLSTLLVDKIKDMCGHALSEDFIQTSLRPLVSRLLRTGNNLLTRNGKKFLGNTEEIDLFSDERIISGANADTREEKTAISAKIKSRPCHPDRTWKKKCRLQRRW